MRLGAETKIVQAVRNAIAGIEPDTWMSPNQPVQPVAPEAAGRLRDYRVGYNLTYTPRAEERTPFWQLRALADTCDLVRLAVETRKDQIAALPWDIGYIDQTRADDDKVAATVKMFKRPDGVHSFDAWLRMLIEEVLVTDAPAVYPNKLNNGKTFAFELLDGTTIKVLTDDKGRSPAPPSPAYQQVIKGLPAVDYSRDELVYFPRNPRVHKFYGYSPVEQIILTVNIALRRQYSQLQYFTEGNIPAAFASVPNDWTPQQIEQFQSYWDTVIEGDQAYKRKARFVPGDTKVTTIHESPLQDTFDEWLARIVCFAFSLPPTAFVKQATRTTSDVLQEAALKEGLAPLTQWVKGVADHLIQVVLGEPDLEFRWVEEDALDPQSQSEILTTYQKTGVYCINDVREKLGEDPIDGGDVYMIFTGTGAIPLDQILHPPAPPPAPNGKPHEVGGDGPKAQPPMMAEKQPETPAATEKHHHDHDLAKVAAETPCEKALASSFEAALAAVGAGVVRQWESGKLGKTMGADGSKPADPWMTPEHAAEFAAGVDLSPFSLAWDDYSGELIATATDGSKSALLSVRADLPDDVAFDLLNHRDERAVQWATEHAAEMLSSDGNGGALADSTRNMIRELVVNGLNDHASRAFIADALRSAYAFSQERAALIAVTEIRNAEQGGKLVAYKSARMDEKRWLKSNNEGVCPLCDANAEQGYIPLKDAFLSGDEAPLAHPNCRCDLVARRKPKET